MFFQKNKGFTKINVKFQESCRLDFFTKHLLVPTSFLVLDNKGSGMQKKCHSHCSESLEASGSFNFFSFSWESVGLADYIQIIV